MDEGTLGTPVKTEATATGRVNRVVALQPSYLPWLGYFEQMALADRFVFLDHVQYTRRDWRNRNRIRTREGWSWLTVPVVQKNRYGQSLQDTRIDPSVNWSRKHREAIRLNYAAAPFFDAHYPYFESVYSRRWEFLLDLCYETTGYLKAVLGLSTPIDKSSELGVDGAKGDLVLNLCRRMQATHYLTGGLAQDYLSREDFRRQGIVLEYQEYRHPEYPQRYPGFVPYLSVIDLLFNVGDRSRDVLMGC